MSDWIQTALLGWMMGAFGGTYLAAAVISEFVTGFPEAGA